MSVSERLDEIESGLGVELADSYRRAYRDYDFSNWECGRLYLPHELRWYEDHPLSEVTPLEGRGIVVGEDPGGNVYLLLADDEQPPVVVGPGVYHLDHDGNVLEQVADDMVELVSGVADTGADTGGEPETIIELLIAVEAPTSDARNALEAAMDARGFTEPPNEYDPDATYVHVDIGSDDRRCLLWMRELGPDQPWLAVARSLAGSLETEVRAYQATVKDLPVQLSDGTEGHWARMRKVAVEADGAMRDLEVDFDDEGADHGDPWETALNLVWMSAERDGLEMPDDRTECDFYRVADDDPLPERLRNIVVAAAEAHSITLSEVAGQQAVRLEFADGKQLSTVSDEELTRLRNHIDID